jgi:hypothetical protein
MGARRAFLRQSIGVVGSSLAPRLAASATPTANTAASTVDMRGPVIGPILERNLQRHPGDGSGQNHVSMAVLACAALGGTPERLQALGERMLGKRNKPFPAGGPTVTPDEWRLLLGNADALPGFRTMFTGEVARRGVAGALRVYLPQLLPGVGSSEFHCLIRTAYGVRFGVPAEVAMALAYWSATFRTLGPVDAEARALDHSLATIARAMVRNYCRSDNDIMALHGVTGTHAYRVIEPFVADKKAGRRYLWQAIGVHVGVAKPDVPDREAAGALPSWAEMAAKAAGEGDHTLKLTDTAREEHAAYGDPIYIRAAAMRLRMA